MFQSFIRMVHDRDSYDSYIDGTGDVCGNDGEHVLSLTKIYGVYVRFYVQLGPDII